MEAGILEFLKPNSLVQILTLCVLAYLVLSGKITRIGKSGITFKREEDTLNMLHSFMKKSNEADEILVQGLNLANKAIQDSVEDRTNLNKKVHALQLGVLKTQILMADTPQEQFELYDEYKKMGGNGWMDVKMEKLRQEHLATSAIAGAMTGEVR